MSLKEHLYSRGLTLISFAMQGYREDLEDGIVFNASLSSGDHIYVIENHTDEVLIFTIDCYESTNVYIKESENPLKTSINVKPGTISSKITISRADPKLPYEIKMKKTWEFEAHDSETYAEVSSSWDEAVDFLLGSTISAPELTGEKPRAHIIDLLHKKGAMFIDPTFPPYSSTLYPVSIEGRFKSICYRKLSQIGRDWTLLHPDIHAETLVLGNLPDSWLITAAACLIECPQLVLNLFPEDYRSLVEEGIYKVYLYINFERVGIILDDYIPCIMNGGPAYTRCISNSAWILFVEKAFAKRYHGYGAILSGDPAEAMMDLSGCPALSVRLDDSDIHHQVENNLFWEKINDYYNRGYILSVTSGKLIEETTGLISGHSFVVMKFVMASSGERFVKLKDPWGLLEFINSWGKNSPLWTTELRQEVGAMEGDYSAGIQWISFEAMLERFHTLNVLMIRRNKDSLLTYKEYRKAINFFMNPQSGIPECGYFTFEAKADCSVIIAVQQKDSRTAKAYIDLGIVVLTITVSHYVHHFLLTSAREIADLIWSDVNGYLSSALAFCT